MNAFSEAMRRREPLLAEEDTNGLFQAFREIRLRHRAAQPWWRSEDAMTGAAYTAVALLGLLPLTKALGVNPLEFTMGLGAVVGMAALMHGAGGARGMPGSLEAIFRMAENTNGRIDSWALREIWTLPCGGRDVLIAISLEMRERRSLSMLALPILLMWGLGFWIKVRGVDERLFADTLLLLPGVGAFVAGYVHALRYFDERVAVDKVAEHVGLWTSPSDIAPQASARGVGRAVVYGVAISMVLGVLLLALHFVWPYFAAFPPMRLRQLTADHSHAIRMTLLNGALAVIGTRLWTMPRRGTARLRQRLEALLEQGDRTYPDFMRRRVLEEPS